MHTYLSTVVAVTAITIGVAPASAQDARAVEVIPYVGIGTAGAAPVGTAVSFPVTSTLSIESDVGYRRGEGDRHALSTSASLLYALPRLGQSTPYVAAGVGVAQFGTPLLSADGPVGTLPRMALTVHAGGGMKMPMHDNLDLRTDARWFRSLGRDGSEQFRVAQGIGFDIGKR
jgi:hypothetical protein